MSPRTQRCPRWYRYPVWRLATHGHHGHSSHMCARRCEGKDEDVVGGSRRDRRPTTPPRR
jgi:hypothetical protein